MNKKYHAYLSLTVASHVCLLSPSIVLADYSSEVLSENPLAYYRFAENIAVPAYDFSANDGSLAAAARGRYTGTVTKGAEGALSGNGAVTFANPTLGTGFFGAVNVPHQPEFNPTPESGAAFTVEFWTRPTTITASLLSPVSSMSFTAGRAGWLFYQNAGTWQMRIGHTGSTTASILDGGTVTANQWQHVVGIYSGGTAGTMTLYVDGAMVSSGAAATYEANPAAPLSIGSTSAPNRTFDGSVDEVAYYPAALSDAQITAHFTARSSNPNGYAALVTGDGAVGYWRLNEAPGGNPFPTAANQGSLGVTGDALYIGGVTTTGTGPRPPEYQGFAADNKAISLPTADGYVGSPLSLINNRTSFTVAGWVKRGAAHSVRGGYFGQNDLLEFGDADNGTTIEVWFAVNNQRIKPLFPAADDTWVFIALTADGQSNELYLNGESGGSLSFPAPVNYGSSAFSFNIGGGGVFNAGGDFFLGEIDEVAVFDRALSKGRVKSLYHAALGTVAPIIEAEPAVLSPVPPATIFTNATFSLISDASGTPPLLYQWRKNGTIIPTATSRIYTKTGAETSDAGSYDVVVTNASGSATSATAVSVAVIVPAEPPMIATPPAARTTLAGGLFTFNVEASGPGPFTYQWFLNGAPIMGATAARYSVAATTATAGNYTVRITNTFSSVTSSPVSATFASPRAGSYEELIMALQPLAYWKLDEPSGTLAADSAGAHDGIYTNAVTTGVLEAPTPANNFPGFSAANRAAEFDGATGYVRGPQGLMNNLTNFTLTGWIRRTAAAGRRSGIFGQNDKVEFGYVSDNIIGGWTGGSNADAPTPLADNEWGFVVFTHEASPGIKTLYINGNPIAFSGFSGQVNTNEPFCIGGGVWNSVTEQNDMFAGQIDEVALFPTVLTQAQACELYARARALPANQAAIRQVHGGIGTVLASGNFDITSEDFTVETPSASSETEWAYIPGSWRSNGQSTAQGSDNVSFLISPEYTVPTAGIVSLSFSHRHSFEPLDWDGGAVEAKVNDGPWQRVSAPSFNQGGYNGRLRVNTVSLLHHRQGFVKNSSGHPAMMASSCALAAVGAGDKLRFRWVASYDNNTTGPLNPSGWEIDSFSLSHGGNGVVATCPCGPLQESPDLIQWTDVTDAAPIIIDATRQTPRKFFRPKP